MLLFLEIFVALKAFEALFLHVVVFILQFRKKTECFLLKWICACNLVQVMILKIIGFKKI